MALYDRSVNSCFRQALFATALALSFTQCAAPSASVSKDNEESKTLFSKADSYERFMGRWSREMAGPFVSFAELKPGQSVLDVGSGTGSLSFLAHRTTQVRVIGIDLSKEYVAYANSKATGADAHFQEGDAQHLKLSDATFDRAVSLLVLNFVPDAALAVREMKRVTKSGGIVASAVWDYGGDMQMLRIFWDEAVVLDSSVQRLDQRNMNLCREGQLGTLFREQGLTEVTEVPLTIQMHFANFEDYWAPFLLGQGSAGKYATHLSPSAQQALKERLRARIFKDKPDGPFDLLARVWAVKGRVQ